MKITGNEPAHPTTTRVELKWDDSQPHTDPKMVAIQEGGLTIRQQFVAMAMQGLCVNTGRNGFNYPDSIAEQAVKIADHLISELNKEA